MTTALRTAHGAGHAPAAPATTTGSTVNILGVNVSASSMSEVAYTVARWATCPPSGASPRFVSATSVHGLIEGRRDPAFRAILNGASCVTPDGMPLVWFGRLRGQATMERVYGPALMKEVCRQTAGFAVRHFLYGGAPGVPEELGRNLQAEFPGLQIAGTFSPPYRSLTESELREVVARINGSGAQIVWVGLSTPKQEQWVAAVRARLNARVLLSVGAAFDFHAGRVRQAPRWMQTRGLEWLFRLWQEPRRLWRRYAYNNPMFLWLALQQLAGLKNFTNVTEVE